MKTNVQLDREIAASLKSAVKARPNAGARTTPRTHELFFLSEGNPGTSITAVDKVTYFERFDDLESAIRALALLPEGSIAYGDAHFGPQFMIVWSIPQHTDLLYWSDGDLNAAKYVVRTTRSVRAAQLRKLGGKNATYFEGVYARARRRHWK